MKTRLAVASAVACVLVIFASTPWLVAQPQNYRAHLSGPEEAPPVESLAEGQVVFQLNADGDKLSFRLIIANIENVRFAHIHSGAVGVAGPVVVTLYPGPTNPGRFDGTLAEGTITSDDLQGVLAGRPLSALISLIEAGGAYVNVHTDQYPGGEIRGQID